MDANQYLLQDINATLRTLLRQDLHSQNKYDNAELNHMQITHAEPGREQILHFTDKDFSALNLKSTYTRSSFFGGIPLDGYDRWQTRLDDIQGPQYTQQSESRTVPAMPCSWDEQREKHEAFLLDLYSEAQDGFFRHFAVEDGLLGRDVTRICS